MLCPHCQAENPQDNHFCAECGKPLTAEESAQQPLREMPAPRASGIVPPKGVGLLLLAGIVVPIVFGYIYHLVTNFIDLLILFPIGVGMGLAFALNFAVITGKCRKPALVLFIALLASVLTYGSRLFFDSVQFRQQALQHYNQASTEDTDNAAMRSFFQQLDPVKTFALYMAISSNEGMTIGRPGRGDSGLPLKGNFYWLVLLVEVGLIAWVATGSRKVATEPFCERCDRWSGETSIFRIPPDQQAELVDLVRRQDWAAIMEMPVTGTIDEKNHCDVTLVRCGECLETALRITCTTKGKEKPLFFAVMPPGSVAHMLETMKQSAEEQPAETADADAETKEPTGV